MQSWGGFWVLFGGGGGGFSGWLVLLCCFGAEGGSREQEGTELQAAYLGKSFLGGRAQDCWGWRVSRPGVGGGPSMMTWQAAPLLGLRAPSRHVKPTPSQSVNKWLFKKKKMFF